MSFQLIILVVFAVILTDGAAASLQRHALTGWRAAEGWKAADRDHTPGVSTLKTNTDMKLVKPAHVFHSWHRVSLDVLISVSGGWRRLTSQSDWALLWGVVEPEQTLSSSAVPVAERHAADPRIPLSPGLHGAETHLQPAAFKVITCPVPVVLHYLMIKNTSLLLIKYDSNIKTACACFQESSGIELSLRTNLYLSKSHLE